MICILWIILIRKQNLWNTTSDQSLIQVDSLDNDYILLVSQFVVQLCTLPTLICYKEVYQMPYENEDRECLKMKYVELKDYRDREIRGSSDVAVPLGRYFIKEQDVRD